MKKTLKYVISILVVLIVGIYVLDAMDAAIHHRELFGFFVLGFLVLYTIFEAVVENKT